MKKLILILAFLPFLGFSQGIDLQLNQVIYLGDMQLYQQTLHTVPEGRIWKITSCAIEGGTATFSIVDPEGNVTSSKISFEGSNYNGQSSFPIWLPEGWGVKYDDSVNGFSILEFNAVSQ